MIPEVTSMIFFFFITFEKRKRSQAHGKLCAIYSDECLSELLCQNEFDLSSSGNFVVNNYPRPGWPIVEKLIKLSKKIEVDRHVSTRVIATELNINYSICEALMKRNEIESFLKRMIMSGHVRK